MNMKKIAAIILSVTLLCCFTTGALAEDVVTAEQEPYIEARFSDFANVFASLTRQDSGFYHVEGGAGTYSSAKWVEITVTIEQYHTNGGFQPVDGFSWSDADYFGASTQATRDLSRGTYRAHTVAKCYRDGVLLETAEAYSPNVNVA